MRPTSVSPSRLGLSLLLLAGIPSVSHPDTVKPVQFGPYLLSHVSVISTPAAYRDVLTNGQYHFQVGWIEPISELSGGIFKDAYFETDGDLNISPFQSDLGTTFKIKPIRYFEVGLSYNRLVFHHSLVTFSRIPGEKKLDVDRAKPVKVLSSSGELSGADVFTFQANLTVDMGPTQLFLMANRSLWDIDVQSGDYAYEYGNDLVIKTRDRINYFLGRFNLDLRRFSTSPAFSFTGVAIRNQFWITDQELLKKNLVSGGITGFRFGRNSELQQRGLDLSVGYWTMHPQLDGDQWLEYLHLQAEWKWNLQMLKL